MGVIKLLSYNIIAYMLLYVSRTVNSIKTDINTLSAVRITSHRIQNNKLERKVGSPGLNIKSK
jgi:hypothetical protein